VTLFLMSNRNPEGHVTVNSKITFKWSRDSFSVWH